MKYLFKVFNINNPDEMIMQVTVPSTDMWSAVQELSEFGIVKGYVLDGEPDVK